MQLHTSQNFKLPSYCVDDPMFSVIIDCYQICTNYSLHMLDLSSEIILEAIFVLAQAALLCKA